MTKEVLVTISGLHFAEENEQDTMELIAAGEYYMRNGAHYIVYEEALEGGDNESVKNIVKIRDDRVEVTKKGAINVHMVFEEKKKNETYYFTPIGSLLLGIHAKQINVAQQEDNVDVKVEYSLDINHEHVADCFIKINAKSKDSGDFSLQ